MRVDFTIPSSPVTKARPRFNTRTGRAFTDDKTRIFENIVSLAYGSRHYFDDSYIRVRIKFKFEIPKSYSKKKRLEALEGKIRPTKKDLDNIAKAVLDGLNTKAFIDDRYIVGLTLEKMYAEENRIDVVIEEAI
jgi:Holliday junction resolvase RusA-like endonuclease